MMDMTLSAAPWWRSASCAVPSASRAVCDILRAVVGLVLLLSMSRGERGPSNPGLCVSITYPPSGIWSGTVTEDDNVRWGPVAGCLEWTWLCFLEEDETDVE